MEVFGSSGGRKKYVSQAMLNKLKNGGMRADAISKKAKAHHANHEIPLAEKILEDQIADITRQTKEKKQTAVQKEQKSRWQRIKLFIQSIFYPTT